MKRTAALLFFCVCTIIGSCAYAETEGYIIELNDDAPLMLMSGEDSVTPLDDNGHYFLAKSRREAEMYAPYAKNICEDFEMELFDYPETTNDIYFNKQWNHPVLKTEALRKAGLDGTGVRIAIIDSGVNVYHEDINTENIVYSYDCITKSEELSAVNDTYGHGSFVTGTIAAITNNSLGIAGITPEAELAIFRVTAEKKLNASNFITSFEKAMNLDCDIINMSLGTPRSNMTQNQYNMLASLIANAEANNIIVTASMGNEGDSTVNYPAAFDSVIGVGSIDQEYSRSSFSDYNKYIFITAPGTSLYGLYYGKKSIYVPWSGTSFSAPEAAAAAAAARQVKPDMTTAEFRQLLIDTATDLGEPGFDIYFGHGLLNYETLTAKLLSLDPSPSPVETIEPLFEYSSKAVIEKTVKYNKLYLTLTPQNESDLSGVRLYRCKYSDGRLTGVREYSYTENNGRLEFIAGMSGDERFMLWDGKCTPVTMPF